MSDINLDDIRIASPCKVPWDSMKGTDTKRYCSQCHLNVYNISEMTTSEAVKLIGSDTGYCFSLYRRPDGTVITRDCPVGIAKIKRYCKWSLALIGSFFTGSVLFHSFMAKEIEEERERQRVYDAARFEMGAKLQAKGKVVYCKKEMKSGELFDSANLEEIEVSQSRIPLAAISSSSLLEKRVAKFAISAGQIVCYQDILTPLPKAYRLYLEPKLEERVQEVADCRRESINELLSNLIRDELF